MELLSGTVDTIRYAQPESGWTVAMLNGDTIVGVMPGLTLGAQVNVHGEWADHPRFGRQFKVKSYQAQVPQHGPALEIFLQEVIYGIGPELAHRIVKQFGETTPQMLDSPELLQQVQGIGREKANEISKSWREHKHERVALENLLAFLVEHEIPTGYAKKIFDEFGFNAVERIRTDPYQLTNIDGIGFKKADAMAMKLGFQYDSPERIRGALGYTLKLATSEGHCYLERDDLLQRATQNLLVNVQWTLVDRQLDIVLADEKSGIVADGDAVYRANLRKAEAGTAQHLHRIAHATDEKMLAFQAFPQATIFEDLPTVDFTYTQQQLDAIWTALTQKVSLITGGPGTGKTSLVNAIVALAVGHNCKVLLVSPTGKAAKRLSEVTGYPASTVHRALGLGPNSILVANEEHPLEVDLIIVDESSMLDISLAYYLVRAVPEGAHIVFVGDVDQLPAVGPGNVLCDLIDSAAYPTTRLQTIFRQGSESYIIPNAHAINTGEMPQFARPGNGGDFYLFEAQDAETAGDWIVDVVAQRVPNAFGIDPNDIQVLSPIHRGAAGDEALNARLQDVLNPPHGQAEYQHGKRVFRVGDRVIQIKNDYERDVFNGDMGRVVKIGRNDKNQTTIWIEFDDGQAHEYTPSDLNEVKLAYALTVHKSQGSEFPVVVMPVLMQHYIMLQRNLLYTGVTRAKQLVVLVGNRKAIGVAVNNNKVQQRNTRLRERISLLSA